MAYTGIHLPRGYTVEVKDNSTWVDLGVTMEAGTLEVSYETTKITGSKAEGILTAFREFSVSATFTLAQIKLGNLHLLMSGATDLTETAGVSKSLSLGSNSVEITPRALRISKNLGTEADPELFSVEIYSAINEGGLSLAFPRYDEDDITTLEITLTGQLDTTRSDLDQLLKITDETEA